MQDTRVTSEPSRRTEAEADLGRSLALDPQQPDALLLRGNLRMGRGDRDGAHADWQQIVESAPGSDQAKAASANLDALSRERWRCDRQRGLFRPLQAPSEVAARGFEPDEWALVESMRRKAFVGSAAQVAEKMRTLAAQYGLDELVVNTWAYDPAVRRRSYALLASEFNLT